MATMNPIMKKIQIIYGGWLSAPNGVSSLIREISNNKDLFALNGLELDIFSLDVNNPRNFEVNTPKSRPRKIKELILKNSKKSKLLSFISVYGLFIRHAKRVVREYQNQNSEADIILFHDIFTSYHYFKKFGISSNQKTAVVLHTNGDTFRMLLSYYPILKNSLYHRYLIGIEKFVLDRVSKVLFVAKNPLETFLNLHPAFNSENTGYIYNGIKLKESKTRLKPEKQEIPIKLCTVGTVSKRKGQDIILESLIRLNKEDRKRFHLTIVGDGPLLEQLKLKAIENELSDLVTFTGSVNNVENILKNSDVFLLISNDEGLPISIMEAMREGLPVISTYVGGIPEMVIPNKNGYLIQPDSHQLINVLRKLLDAEPDLSEFGNESRTIFIERFTTEKMINNYIETLTSL